MSLIGYSLRAADRVKETTNTTGTGAYSLNGAAPGFRSFATIGDGNIAPYVAAMGTTWEIGLGTISAGATDTLTRDEILSSSNGGSLINWGAGVKDIWLDIPGEWLERVGPWQAFYRPQANGTNVVTVENVDGADAVILRVTPAGDGNVQVRNAAGVERARMVGGGTVEVTNPSGTTTAYMDGSSGNIFSNDRRVDAFAAGTRLPFVQASAPTGWTLDTTNLDRVLMTASGGNTLGGQWAITGLTHFHTHDHGSAQHKHEVPVASAGNVTTVNFVADWPHGFSGASRGFRDEGEPPSSAIAGSLLSGPVVHISNSATTGPNDSGVASSGAWRPAHLNIIVCTKT